MESDFSKNNKCIFYLFSMIPLLYYRRDDVIGSLGFSFSEWTFVTFLIVTPTWKGEPE